jgi:hypothetical protein
MDNVFGYSSSLRGKAERPSMALRLIPKLLLWERYYDDGSNTRLMT